MIILGHSCFGEVNLLHQGPHIFGRGLDLHNGCTVFFADQRQMNYNRKSFVFHLSAVISPLFAHTLFQNRCQRLDPLSLTVDCLRFLAFTYHVKHIHPPWMNPFHIINSFLNQHILKCNQIICNCHLPVYVSSSKMFYTVQSLDSGPILHV